MFREPFEPQNRRVRSALALSSPSGEEFAATASLQESKSLSCGVAARGFEDKEIIGALRSIGR
jgi:hypothetical protein